MNKGKKSLLPPFPVCWYGCRGDSIALVSRSGSVGVSSLVEGEVQLEGQSVRRIIVYEGAVAPSLWSSLPNALRW